MKNYTTIEALVNSRARYCLKDYAKSKGMDILGGSIQSIRREIIKERNIVAARVQRAVTPEVATHYGIPLQAVFIPRWGWVAA